MSKKKVILFSLIFALTASFAGNIATPMADTIKEQKAQKKKLEKKRAKEAEKIEKLKAQKVEIEDAIKKLDEKKEVIELNISDYNTKIDKMEKTIAKVEVEIKAAEKVEKDQYDIMKKRIRYMYELIILILFLVLSLLKTFLTRVSIWQRYPTMITLFLTDTKRLRG